MKNFHTKPCVFTAPDTVHTCKLSQAKTTKGHSYQKVQTAQQDTDSDKTPAVLSQVLVENCLQSLHRN